MGWLAKKATDPEFKDIAWLTHRPIERFAPLMINMRKPPPAADVRTILHRLAHLIVKTSATNTTPEKSILVAKWYLANLANVPLDPKEHTLLDSFVTRLEANVQRWESLYGFIDTGAFDLLVEFAGERPDVILYGPPLFTIIEPTLGTPQGNLSKTISWYGWRQNSIEDARS